MSEALLKDQVVWITGAGRAPATSLALALAEQGAVIAASDLSPVLLDPLGEAVRAHLGRIKTYAADATRGMPLRALLDEILTDWGRIDILINNPRIRPETSMLDMDEWDWQRTVEMNMNGPFLTTQFVAREMREQGQGVILNIIDANPSTLEAPGRAAYAASQQGLLALSQAAARELIAYNIRVHALCPEDALLYPESHVPDPGEDPGRALANLAVFLCSPAAAHLAGQTIWVSGSQAHSKPVTPSSAGLQE